MKNRKETLSGLYKVHIFDNNVSHFLCFDVKLDIYIKNAHMVKLLTVQPAYKRPEKIIVCSSFVVWPTFSTLWDNYPTASQYKGNDLIDKIGLPDWLHGANTCAIRLSYALIQSGKHYAPQSVSGPSQNSTPLFSPSTRPTFW